MSLESGFVIWKRLRDIIKIFRLNDRNSNELLS